MQKGNPLDRQSSRFAVWASTALTLSVLGTTLQAAENTEPGKSTSASGTARPSSGEGQSGETVRLAFRLKIDRQVYIQSDWGHPPQLAIWLEQPDGGKIRTLWVTYRTGACDWTGKAACPVSLPYWVGRYNRETNTTGPPTYQRPVADAITQPTPKDEFRMAAEVPRGSTWDYFIEVNVSGDYNAAFPSVRDDGVEQLVLRLEVVVHHGGGDARAFRDFRHGGAGHALLRELPDGRIQQLGPHVRTVFAGVRFHAGKSN